MKEKRENVRIIRKDQDDRNSLKHCRRSAYRFFIHYIDGANYTFEQLINNDNAVRIVKFYYLFNIHRDHL